ncbi:MAG TPA: YueI family protein [Chondromyces sp.]|nr:YueI family protein [Chondromyces sp.]
MKKPNVEDYVQNGIYGTKQLKPEERKKFLGTFRERIEGVLTTRQVYQRKAENEVDKWLSKVKDGQLLLNGDIDYSYLSPYIKLANRHSLPYTIVENQHTDTDIGLVLAHADAVDKENIWYEEKPNYVKEEKKKNGLWTKIKKTFKKKN